MYGVYATETGTGFGSGSRFFLTTFILPSFFRTTFLATGGAACVSLSGSCSADVNGVSDGVSGVVGVYEMESMVSTAVVLGSCAGWGGEGGGTSGFLRDLRGARCLGSCLGSGAGSGAGSGEGVELAITVGFRARVFRGAMGLPANKAYSSSMGRRVTGGVVVAVVADVDFLRGEVVPEFGVEVDADADTDVVVELDADFPVFFLVFESSGSLLLICKVVFKGISTEPGCAEEDAPNASTSVDT